MLQDFNSFIPRFFSVLSYGTFVSVEVCAAVGSGVAYTAICAAAVYSTFGVAYAFFGFVVVYSFVGFIGAVATFGLGPIVECAIFGLAVDYGAFIFFWTSFCRFASTMVTFELFFLCYNQI